MLEIFPKPDVPNPLDTLPDGETFDLRGTEMEDPWVAIATYDFGGIYALLNHINVDVSIAHDMEGLYDEMVTTPCIAVEKPGGTLYTMITSGFFHRVRIKADEKNEYYHVRFIEATMYYQGQLA